MQGQIGVELRQCRLVKGHDIVAKDEGRIFRQGIEAADQIGRLAGDPQAGIQIGAKHTQLAQGGLVLAGGFDIKAQTPGTGCVSAFRHAPPRKVCLSCAGL
jgi:hypothetical protein